LSDPASAVHDESRRGAVLTGGILSKAVAVELAKDGYCTSKRSTLAGLCSTHRRH
jgi:hypothetical protein